MKKTLNFRELAGALLANSREYVIAWCPGGKIQGNEYVCGSINGGPGDSFRVNLQTGKWAEFAGDLKGGDLIALYAAINNLSQGEAYKALSRQPDSVVSQQSVTSDRPTEASFKLVPPPSGHEFHFLHPRHGKPSFVWPYNDPKGQPIFYVARYDTPDGKQLCPWSWCANRNTFVSKGWFEPRPLMGLDLLAQRPKAPVMVVEGEKCVDAARLLCGQTYVVVTWCNGSNGVNKTDWKPLFGRKVLIWPDADRKAAKTPQQARKTGVSVGEIMPYGFQPGPAAAAAIAGILARNCKEVKVLDVGMDTERIDGWDVADAVAEGWTWEKVVEWAVPRAKLITLPDEMVQEAEVVEPVDEPVKVQHDVIVHAADEEESRPSSLSVWEKLGIAVAKNGSPIISMDTALRIFERHEEFKGTVWFDEFHQAYFTTWRGKLREWSEIDTLRLTAFVQRDLGMQKMPDDYIFKAMLVHAEADRRNEPRDWMKTLKWDGVPRIGSFFSHYFGAERNNYTCAASGNFWIGMVARVLRPGCKVDNMVVLEGSQGTYKSTALDMIGHGWYAEAQESVTSKDFFMVMRGKLIVEIAELDSFSRADTTRIKQVITCRTDRFRAPYARVAKDNPRMCIFVGTTNEDQYLSDNTGGRRFWPIRCGRIDREKIASDRDQLFAEAVNQFHVGASWWEMPGEETLHQQEMRRHADEWQGAIEEFVNRDLGFKNDFTVRELAAEALHIGIDKLGKREQWRIGGIMKALGWERKLDRRDGDVVRVWRRPMTDDSME